MRNLGGNPCSNCSPRNDLCFTGVQILDTPGNLLIPCGLGGFVNGWIEALDQRTRQFGTLFIREGESLL